MNVSFAHVKDATFGRTAEAAKDFSHKASKKG